MNNIIASAYQRIKELFEVAQELKKTPEKNYLTDAKGRICHADILSPVDIARNTLVNNCIQRALELSKMIDEFKQETFAQIDAFIYISNSEHNAKIGVRPEHSQRKWKGNIQLLSYNGSQKILWKVQDKIAFNEKLNLAMEKLQGLIKERSGDIDEIIQVMVNEAFRVDQLGYVDPKKILDLRKYKITHPVWVEAMQDINDSMQPNGSRSYLQFWHRDTPESEWLSIPLDIARL